MFEASVIKWKKTIHFHSELLTSNHRLLILEWLFPFPQTEKKNFTERRWGSPLHFQKFETKLHGPLNIFTHYDTSVTNLKRQTLTSSSIETLLFGSESDLTLILCVNLRHPEGPAEVSCFSASYSATESWWRSVRDSAELVRDTEVVSEVPGELKTRRCHGEKKCSAWWWGEE